MTMAVDDAGLCANWLSKLWRGGCFVYGPLVTLSGNFISGWRLSAAQLWNDFEQRNPLMSNTDETIEIRLPKDDALTLLDWLARFNEGGMPGTDDVEKQLLYDLEAMFEQLLVEPSMPLWEQDGIEYAIADLSKHC